MKNKKLKTTFVFLAIGLLLVTMYIHYTTNDEPNEVIVKWLFKDPTYKNKTATYMVFGYTPSYKECDAYCKLSNNEWLEIRVKKGFLGTWKVVHVKEVSVKELPEWVYEDINKEPKIFEEWKEKHRDRVKKMITYDEYIRDGTLYYIKLKDDVWLILRLNKNSFEDWSIEEREIGKDPEEISESLSILYKKQEITAVEIEKFLEILAEDGMDTIFIRDKLKEKGVPL